MEIKLETIPKLWFGPPWAENSLQISVLIIERRVDAMLVAGVLAHAVSSWGLKETQNKASPAGFLCSKPEAA